PRGCSARARRVPPPSPGRRRTGRAPPPSPRCRGRPPAGRAPRRRRPGRPPAAPPSPPRTPPCGAPRPGTPRTRTCWPSEHLRLGLEEPHELGHHPRPLAQDPPPDPFGGELHLRHREPRLAELGRSHVERLLLGR